MRVTKGGLVGWSRPMSATAGPWVTAGQKKTDAGRAGEVLQQSSKAAPIAAAKDSSPKQELPKDRPDGRRR